MRFMNNTTPGVFKHYLDLHVIVRLQRSPFEKIQFKPVFWGLEVVVPAVVVAAVGIRLATAA